MKLRIYTIACTVLVALSCLCACQEDFDNGPLAGDENTWVLNLEATAAQPSRSAGVDEYNEKLYAEDYSLDETDKVAQEFIDKIKGLDNADKDATCQHILIESALALDDIATAESSYKTLVDLEDKGVYPSNRLFDATASENLRKSIDAAKEYLEAGPLPEGQG